MKLFKLTLFAVLTVLSFSCSQRERYVRMSHDAMLDKVKGAWAGKMIGVMYGRPMEFAVTDTLFTDSIKWKPEFIEAALLEDDIYGQLNFMTTMEKYGQDVSIDSLAKNFAYAEFPLCHANLQARKNYMDGIPAEELSLPQNSIHCEDIDFQIECDFIGFVNPCMPQASNRMCEKVGRIMSASDGLYAGMFVSAMHTLAFNSNNIESVITEALKAIPSESAYAQCISDVLDSYRQAPNNWVAAWEMLHQKWAPYDVCTPYLPFNIDAKLNGAYVVMGLIYGQGDWEKTMEITIRCGQDTDCNTATAAAVLGIMHGYKAIPEIYKSHIPQIADREFLHTAYSFNKAVDQTMCFIAENVVANGGKTNEDEFLIKTQRPLAPAYEKGFAGIKVEELIPVTDSLRFTLTGQWEDFVYGEGDYAPYKVSTSPSDELKIDFEGTGIALMGSWNTDAGKAQVALDNEFVKEIDSYYVSEAGKFEGNRAYLYYITDLPAGPHTLMLRNIPDKNPKSSGNKIYIEKALIYK